MSEINQNVQAINDLGKTSPSVRSFGRLDKRANDLLEDLKVTVRELNILLYNANPEIETDEEYIADQKGIRNSEFVLLMSLMNIMTI